MMERFNRKGFMAYMEEQFNGMENCLMRGLIDNLIDYGLSHMGSANEFCGWLFRMIPELTLPEVERFLVTPAGSTCSSPIEVPEISREDIRRGIEMEVVKFVVDPNMGSGTVCQIGDHWFYFGGETAEKEEPEEFLANAYLNEIVGSIYITLADFRRLDELQLEYAYYAHYLQENGVMAGQSRSKDTPAQDSYDGGDHDERTPIQRELEITVRVNGSDFEVDVYEPESGEVSQFQFPFSPDGHPEFDPDIGNEIYSWVSLWMESEEDM